MLNAAGPLTAVINLSGHPRVTLFDNALVFSANFALCTILVPRYGMAGAATSTLIALCSVTLLQVGQVARLFRIHPFRDDQLRCSRRAGRGRRHGCADVAAVALVAARGGVGVACSSRYTRAGVAMLGVRDETREAVQRARAPVLSPWVLLIERMGGVAS